MLSKFEVFWPLFSIADTTSNISLFYCDVFLTFDPIFHLCFPRDNRQDAAYSPASYQSGDGGRHDYDDDMDYDLPDTRQGSAGRRLEPLFKNNNNHKSPNHVLPHDRLRAVSDDK